MKNKIFFKEKTNITINLKLTTDKCFIKKAIGWPLILFNFNFFNIFYSPGMSAEYFRFFKKADGS